MGAMRWPRAGRLVIGHKSGITLAHTGGGGYETLASGIIVPGKLLGTNGILIVTYHLSFDTTIGTAESYRLLVGGFNVQNPSSLTALASHNIHVAAQQNSNAIQSRLRSAVTDHGWGVLNSEVDSTIDMSADAEIKIDVKSGTPQNVRLKYMLVEAVV